jgi:hypothetical protein
LIADVVVDVGACDEPLLMFDDVEEDDADDEVDEVDDEDCDEEDEEECKLMCCSLVSLDST